MRLLRILRQPERQQNSRYRAVSIPKAAGRLRQLKQGRELIDYFKLKSLPVTAELLVIAIWAIFVTRPYLNLGSNMLPTGREYLSTIQTHHLWPQVIACGWCALWNGSLRGGAPALIDLHGSMLHPLVMVSTLVLGVLNGSKLALTGAFFLCGLAQWWLARVLGLGRAARIWTALLAVVGGHLAGRMEHGTFGMIISIAASALVLPPLIALHLTPSRRHAVLLGLMLAQLLLAGQGYLQIGVLLCLPVVFLLQATHPQRRSLLWRRYVLAGSLACLLAGFFLVPFLHFFPNFAKDLDPSIKSAQSFSGTVLNLVINDPRFYYTDALGKLPYPYLYTNYIGWIAILLAVGAVFGHRREQRSLIIIFSAMALVALWLASGSLFRWLSGLQQLPALAEFAAGVRHAPLISALAVPPILALAGLGLDTLISSRWRHVQIGLLSTQQEGVGIRIQLSWILALPLVLSVASALSFSKHFIGVVELPSQVPTLLSALKTPSLQWVNPPFGEHNFIERGIFMNLKLSPGVRPWNWKGRAWPQPMLEADRKGQPPGMLPHTIVDNVWIYKANADREYAAVVLNDGSRVPCTASGSGGDIDVTCRTDQPGVLTILENAWSGWYVTIDGQPAELAPGRWLSTALPAGDHTVRFRYRPWDVRLGLGLSLLGLVLSVYFWLKRG